MASLRDRPKSVSEYSTLSGTCWYTSLCSRPAACSSFSWLPALIGFFAGVDWDLEFARDAGVDGDWLRPLHDLVRKAAAAGYGADSIAAVTEVIRTS